MGTVAKYWHTLRYLRGVQVYGRVWRRVYQPLPASRPVPLLRQPAGRPWRSPPARDPMLVGPSHFHLLNHQRSLAFPGGWNDPQADRLWLYHLHYFDDLTARDAPERLGWHQQLVDAWIRDNRPCQGVGWEPYPLSRRIVNWMKWLLSGAPPTESILASLAIQTRALQARIEFHLLGNHLLANAKALVFAGLFFDGEEPQRWLAKGIEILDRQLLEQILEDGGHFELSPMYHSLVLEDLLDLLNLGPVYGAAASPLRSRDATWRGTAQRMRRWLGAMSLPDGQIALLSDAAFGVALSPGQLDEYAQRLDLPAVAAPERGIVHLAPSGYVRLSNDAAVAILDVGQIGPSYLAGHGHADVLTFELALGNQRVVVDSGTSVYYGNDRERLAERGTAAHNTVVVDDADSSEIWGNFRVARRARPLDLVLEDRGPAGLAVGCSHDGYRRLAGNVTHRRQWLLRSNGLTIEDTLEGHPQRATARLHLHPDVIATNPTGAPSATLQFRSDNLSLSVEVEGVAAHVGASTYHPEFGQTIANQVIVADLAGDRARYDLRW